jgi:peptidoglycan/xylan/chitin deacetylase (PgdA/CDA1 family)
MARRSHGQRSGVTAATALLALAGCGSGPSSKPPPAPRATTAPATRASAARDAAQQLPSPGAQQAAVDHYASVGRPVYCGGRHGRLVALTFDDGPGPYTRIALRELRRSGARATFFLVGSSIARYPQWPARERELAAIGDHTMTHPRLASLSFAAAMVEVRDGRDAARRATGAPVDLFRPPLGSHTDAIDHQVGRDGMAEILWDVDSTDSRTSPPADYRAISAKVRRNLRPGSIVLMHENRGQTIRALRGILPALQRRGLRSVTVPELLAADPPSKGQLLAGRRGCGPDR